MFVCELDPMGWQDVIQHRAEGFRGIQARYTIEPRQLHRLETLAGQNSSSLFDLFEHPQQGCRQ
jgi:hypothetical protein